LQTKFSTKNFSIKLYCSLEFLNFHCVWQKSRYLAKSSRSKATLYTAWQWYKYHGDILTYIFTEDSDFNNLKFEILNLNGILVREIKITGRVTPFSVTGLKSGLFLYRLISDDKEIDAGKILIQPFYTH
jgi:hypothetical protein